MADAATSRELGVAFLAFAGTLGGAVVGAEAVRAYRRGDLLGTDAPAQGPRSPAERLGLLGASVVAAGLTVKSIGEAAQAIGTAPLVIGSAGVAGVAAVLRKRR